MDIKKTLRYNWEFGRETVAIRVSSYRNNGNFRDRSTEKKKPQKTKKQSRGKER